MGENGLVYEEGFFGMGRKIFYVAWLGGGFWGIAFSFVTGHFGPFKLTGVSQLTLKWCFPMCSRSLRT